MNLHLVAEVYHGRKSSWRVKVVLFFFVLMVVAVVTIFWVAMASKIARISQVRVNQPALAESEVDSLLGHPDRIDHAEATGITGDVYYYKAYSNFKVTFVNGVEIKADYFSGAKS